VQSGRTIEVLPVPARYFSSQKSEEEELFRHLKSFWAWPTKFGTSLVWIVRVPEKWLNLVTLNLLRFLEESLSNRNHWVSKTTLLFDSRMPRELIFVRSASDYKSLYAQSLCTATNFASMGIESHNSNGYAH